MENTQTIIEGRRYIELDDNNPEEDDKGRRLK